MCRQPTTSRDAYSAQNGMPWLSNESAKLVSAWNHSKATSPDCSAS
jgi:hypothetical protein